MKKTVYLIGDSLCCSRPNDFVSLKDLYSFKLQERFSTNMILIDRSCSSNTTSISVKNPRIVNDFLSTSIDVLIVHLGIVDAFPRTFYEHYYQFFSLLESIRYTKKTAFWIKKYISKKRSGSSLKPFVDPRQFKNNIYNLIELGTKNNERLKVFLISITQPGDFLISRCKNIRKIIIKYNEILEQISKKFSNVVYISCDTIGLQNHLTSDGHHILSSGHELLFNRLAKEFADENII